MSEEKPDPLLKLFLEMSSCVAFTLPASVRARFQGAESHVFTMATKYRSEQNLETKGATEG